MPKPEKVERVAELKARIDGSAALLLTEYRGLTVSEISELRRSLAEGGASFAVVKNTLMRRAVADAGVAELEAMLVGPSAVTFIDDDPVAAAKSVVEAQKRYPALELKGGYMDGHVLSADEAKALADLESREVMLSKIAGLLKGDLSKAAALLVGAQSKFLSVLEAFRAKLPEEEAVDEEEAAESPGATVEAEPTSVSDGGGMPTTEDAAADRDTSTSDDATTDDATTDDATTDDATTDDATTDDATTDDATTDDATTDDATTDEAVPSDEKED